MKLSSTPMIVEYRAKLTSLRAARNSLDGDRNISCSTWYRGEEYNFCALLSKTAVKQSLAILLDREIAETVRSLEAHGVIVDE